MTSSTFIGELKRESTMVSMDGETRGPEADKQEGTRRLECERFQMTGANGRKDNLTNGCKQVKKNHPIANQIETLILSQESRLFFTFTSFFDSHIKIQR